jgi:hypothetical protein
MISLRLSEGEYAALKAEYRTFGARSVSDLARLALQRVVGMPAPPDDEIQAKLKNLDGRLNALEARVAGLSLRTHSEPRP